jgi:hypothetical protein
VFSSLFVPPRMLSYETIKHKRSHWKWQIWMDEAFREGETERKILHFSIMVSLGATAAILCFCGVGRLQWMRTFWVNKLSPDCKWNLVPWQIEIWFGSVVCLTCPLSNIQPSVSFTAVPSSIRDRQSISPFSPLLVPTCWMRREPQKHRSDRGRKGERKRGALNWMREKLYLFEVLRVQLNEIWERKTPVWRWSAHPWWPMDYNAAVEYLYLTKKSSCITSNHSSDPQTTTVLISLTWHRFLEFSKVLCLASFAQCNVLTSLHIAAWTE